MEERNLIKEIVFNIEKVIIGKEYEIYNIIKGIIANGHILIEDVPGVGKTTLVKALAKSLSLSYRRIQFTPDLLPSDILGVSIYNQKSMEFEFKKGPIFSNIVLADEINRTSPKTQAALLEVMEEKQVSEGNATYKLEEPFIVLATQNPIEYEGTFTLPEAQLDRFIIKVNIGYPEKSYENKMLKIYRTANPLESISSIAKAEDIINLQKRAKDIYVSDEINSYIVNIAESTRDNKYLSLGVSPRASLSLLRICQASALINERNYVIPEDIKENAVRVLSHRIILSPYGRSNNYTEEMVIKDILKMLPVPKVKGK
ncbi:MoxR-like ATPase [Clostridium tetanomorphum]|uniref:AAA domain-containing protein n=1 Tax=Clostridium tetanomorphum TaxID=1553 RepID=A0A923J2H2_CLOTT|nr:MoxR family ATPase [Clostridium tetanomorphum]KAJ50410.1 methanol dehydrogenase regulatory protein (moxR) [Clostridium tetanomorphum DSM 665]MBC2398695.1 AAA domain-containing protein [Clostridium tetanomorphum]MBP1865776.1 MoxR-like ATPase [Clostridium tetanomorphum]NRS86897.1 MoxR-like ATPase [Clostridium tetanomorphum]NRZ99345.1 MoxR-like ATPase [Clostridium tetanomorphum]